MLREEEGEVMGDGNEERNSKIINSILWNFGKFYGLENLLFEFKLCCGKVSAGSFSLLAWLTQSFE